MEIEFVFRVLCLLTIIVSAVAGAMELLFTKP